jgi:hypothetical protein
MKTKYGIIQEIVSAFVCERRDKYEEAIYSFVGGISFSPA